MGLIPAFIEKEDTMPQKHSSMDGQNRPSSRHQVEQRTDEQLDYFTEKRRREAEPRKLIRPSPSKPKTDEDKS